MQHIDCAYQFFGAAFGQNAIQTRFHLGDLRRAPAAFTTDDLVTPSVTRLWAHEQGLQNAVFGDGSSEFLQRLTVRFHARLKGAGFDHGNRQAARRARGWGGGRRRITHQGR
jgi:hypothetical protein